MSFIHKFKYLGGEFLIFEKYSLYLNEFPSCNMRVNAILVQQRISVVKLPLFL